MAESVGPTYTVDLVFVPSLISATAGVLSGGLNLTSCPTNIPNWSSRWAACFSEYRVIGVRAYARCINASGVAQGTVLGWVDEKNNAPSSTTASSARAAVMPASAAAGTVGTVQEFTWVPHDIADLDFISTGSAANLAYLLLYASPSLTGTGAASTFTIQLNTVVRVQFRSII